MTPDIAKLRRQRDSALDRYRVECEEYDRMKERAVRAEAACAEYANLPSVVRDLCERLEMKPCFFDDDGDCGNWEGCDPHCPVAALREMAGFTFQNDNGDLGPTPTKHGPGQATLDEIERLREALATIPPERLRMLAEWLDLKHPEYSSDEVQRDLRLMADRSSAALAGKEREMSDPRVRCDVCIHPMKPLTADGCKECPTMTDETKCPKCGRIVLGSGPIVSLKEIASHGNREFVAPDPSLYCFAPDSEPCLRRQVAALRSQMAAMTADRDSWRAQNDARVADVVRLGNERDALAAAAVEMRAAMIVAAEGPGEQWLEWQLILCECLAKTTDPSATLARYRSKVLNEAADVLDAIADVMDAEGLDRAGEHEGVTLAATELRRMAGEAGE